MTTDRIGARRSPPARPVNRWNCGPSPHNRHDKQAVAVWSKRGQQLGYLSAERCGRIGALIRKGHEVRAVFQRPDRAGAWIRVAFDGEEPVVAVDLDD